MQKQGTVIRWDATRAFGFIRSPGTSADVFFHLRDFRGSAPPREGLAVNYEEIHVGGKGPRAMAVEPAGLATRSTGMSRNPPARDAARPRPDRGNRNAPRSNPSPRAARTRGRRGGGQSASAGLALALTFGWVLMLGWGISAHQLPLGWTLTAAAAVNVVTFCAYAADKSAAMHGRWRTQEKHLHLLGLAGGWPAAWLAQQVLRHKSSKPEFRAVYWLTVVVHCAALAAWITGLGR